MADLTFIATQSVAAFKKAHNIDNIDVVINPKTDLRFFVDRDNSAFKGAVAKELDYNEELAISEVAPKEGPNAGVSFYMLHNKQQSDNVERSL